MVDEEKFRDLNGDVLRKINQNGILPLVIAHLFSLSLIREVFGRQMQQGKVPEQNPVAGAAGQRLSHRRNRDPGKRSGGRTAGSLFLCEAVAWRSGALCRATKCLKTSHIFFFPFPLETGMPVIILDSAPPFPPYAGATAPPIASRRGTSLNLAASQKCEAVIFLFRRATLIPPRARPGRSAAGARSPAPRPR